MKSCPIPFQLALEYAISVIQGTQELELSGTCQLLSVLVMLLQKQK